jgi:hypothetical protein
VAADLADVLDTDVHDGTRRPRPESDCVTERPGATPDTTFPVKPPARSSLTVVIRRQVGREGDGR